MVDTVKRSFCAQRHSRSRRVPTPGFERVSSPEVESSFTGDGDGHPGLKARRRTYSNACSEWNIRSFDRIYRS